MSGHGGSRKGAGRPRKWLFDDMLSVGLACENMWHIAQNDAQQTGQERLFREDSDIQALWDSAKAVPVPRRKEWLASEAYETLRADMETELNALNGTPEREEAAPRLVQISTKPPRGTRSRILQQAGERFALPKATVDNLWQEYRRFQKEIRKGRSASQLDF